MSDYSSFDKDKKIFDNWRNFLNESAAPGMVMLDEEDSLQEIAPGTPAEEVAQQSLPSEHMGSGMGQEQTMARPDPSAWPPSGYEGEAGATGGWPRAETPESFPPEKGAAGFVPGVLATDPVNMPVDNRGVNIRTGAPDPGAHMRARRAQGDVLAGQIAAPPPQRENLNIQDLVREVLQDMLK
jgi:hypothetical protein